MSHSWGLVEMRFDQVYTWEPCPWHWVKPGVQITNSEALLDFCLRVLGSHGKALQRPDESTFAIYRVQSPHPTQEQSGGDQWRQTWPGPEALPLQQDPSV